MVHALNVDTASRHICGHQYAQFPGLELFEGTNSGLLAYIAGKDSAVDAIACQEVFLVPLIIHSHDF